MKNLQIKSNNVHIVVKKIIFIVILNKYCYVYLDNNDIYLFSLKNII